MPSFNLHKNVGAYVSVYPLEGNILTETTTETHSTGASGWVDRLNDWSKNYQSCKAGFIVHATLPAAATVTISGNLQDATSSSGAGAADHGSSTQSAVIGSTASTAAQTLYGGLFYDVDLTEANQFLRAQYSLSFSSSSTSATNQVDAVIPVLVLGGADVLPSS